MSPKYVGQLRKWLCLGRSAPRGGDFPASTAAKTSRRLGEPHVTFFAISRPEDTFLLCLIWWRGILHKILRFGKLLVQ